MAGYVVPLVLGDACAGALDLVLELAELVLKLDVPCVQSLRALALRQLAEVEQAPLHRLVRRVIQQRVTDLNRAINATHQFFSQKIVLTTARVPPAR